MKTEKRKEARKLRKEKGLSIGKIAEELEVSKSSVSLWVRDIELTREQEMNLKPCNRPDAIRKQSEFYSKKRLEYQKRGRVRVLEEDALYISGCMLYWGEGSKNKNTIYFTNSDPNMMVFFMKFLRKKFDVQDEKISISINCFDDILGLSKIQKFWLEKLDLPKKCMKKCQVNHHSNYSKKKRKNKLKYGTCRIQVASVEIIQEIYGAIQEYGGFENEEWL